MPPGKVYRRQRQERYRRRCAPSADSDQPAHSRRVIRIFTERSFDNQGRKVSFGGKQKCDHTAHMCRLI